MKATREDTIGYNLKKGYCPRCRRDVKKISLSLILCSCTCWSESEKKDQLKEEKNRTMPFRWTS